MAKKKVASEEGSPAPASPKAKTTKKAAAAKGTTKAKTEKVKR